MGSFERKMKRNMLKSAHSRFKQQWRAEDRRRAGMQVPLDWPNQAVGTSLSNETAPNKNDEEVSTTVKMVPMKPMPRLGRPPSLAQYGKMVERAMVQQKEQAEKQAAEFLKRREEEEKKLAEQEWKDE